MPRLRELLVRKPFAYILAILMWASTGGIAVWEVLLVRAAVQRLTTRLFLRAGSPSELLAAVKAVPIANVAGLLMGGLALVIVIGGFDFYYEHAGRRRAWVIFGWTLAIQLVLLGFCYLV